MTPATALHLEPPRDGSASVELTRECRQLGGQILWRTRCGMWATPEGIARGEEATCPRCRQAAGMAPWRGRSRMPAQDGLGLFGMMETTI